MKKNKLLKLKKVKIANVNITNRVFGGGKTDSCGETCIPPVTSVTIITKDTCSACSIKCEN